MHNLKNIKRGWILVISLIVAIGILIIWQIQHKGITMKEIFVSNLIQYSKAVKLDIEQTVEFENKTYCHNKYQEEQEWNNMVFAVISGFSIRKELILSAEKNLHFILVGQHNDTTDRTVVNQTVKNTLEKNDESTLQFVFCRDHLDTNSTIMISRLSTLFSTSIIERHFTAVIFLDIESQHSMWPAISELIQENLIARKNIGYLLAIALGAEYIIDLDGSQIITQPESLSIERLTEFKSNSKHPVIASLHSNVNNPYVLMGPRTNLDKDLNSENAMKNIWPRGYPMSEVTHKEVPTLHSLEELSTRLAEKGSVEDCFQFSNDIIQSLVDETPDVHSEYQKDSPPLPVTFLPQSSRLSIHPSQFAPFNAHSTIFSRHAFWALLLPGSVGEMVSDIWRGYIAQTFLHCIRSLLAFSAPIVKQVYEQVSNVANAKHSQDGSEELSSQTQALIGFLSTFNCLQYSSEVSKMESTTSLPLCMIVLYSKLVNSGFLNDEKDISLIHEWIKALGSLGYLFPEFHHNKECLAKGESLYQINWNFTDRSFCNVTTNPSTIAPPGRRQCGNSLLTVVHINSGHKEVIPVWLAQWQYVYPNPIFYISELRNHKTTGSCILEPTDYFDITCNVKDENGNLAYESMINAITRYPNYSSYLFIHDDAYISNKALQNVLEEGVSAMCQSAFVDGPNGWSWRPYVLNSLNIIASHDYFLENSIYRNYTGKFCPELYSNESKMTEGNYLFYFTMADVFILSHKDIEAFNDTINIYLDADMFLEVAVPNTLRCALNATEIDSTTYWDDRRNNIEHNLKEICGANPSQILHPVWKISHGEMNDEDWWGKLDKFITIRSCDIAK